MANKYLLKPVLKTAKQAFYLEDENGNTVSVKGDEHDLDYPEVGKHTGRIVYAQNSGYVIEVEYDTAK